jgi:outer membrane protein OmpA-like peptidoglycan-associated protein
MIKIILIIILNQGEVVFPLLRVGIGARASALGESFVGVTDDIQGIWWNPASNSMVKQKGIFFSYNHWFVDFKDFYSGFFLPTKYINTGINILYSETKEIELRDKEGNYLGLGNQNAYVIQFSFSKNIWPYFMPGISIKFLQEKLPQIQGKGFCFDAGFVSLLKENFSLGFSLRNAGTFIKYNDSYYPIPFELKTGIHQKIKDFLGLFFDLTFPNKKRFHINTGIEIWIKKILALRGGYRYVDEINKFTFGGGLKWKEITLDYAFADYGKLGFTHRISLCFLFPQYPKEPIFEKTSKGTIEGNVYDIETNEKIEAVIYFEGKINGESYTKNGKYVIKELPLGKYKLKVVPENKLYFTQEKEIEVLSPKIIKEDFGLFKSGQKFVIYKIYFETGKANILSISYPFLDEIGKILLANPELKIEIEGHTDNVPISTPEFPSNIHLSKARAEAVKKYIVNKFKIDPERIKTVGYGDTKPIASNETEEGRALNRRIEIIFFK